MHVREYLFEHHKGAPISFYIYSVGDENNRISMKIMTAKTMLNTLWVPLINSLLSGQRYPWWSQWRYTDSTYSEDIHGYHGRGDIAMVITLWALMGMLLDGTLTNHRMCTQSNRSGMVITERVPIVRGPQFKGAFYSSWLHSKHQERFNIWLRHCEMEFLCFRDCLKWLGIFSGVGYLLWSIVSCILGFCS